MREAAAACWLMGRCYEHYAHRIVLTAIIKHDQSQGQITFNERRAAHARALRKMPSRGFKFK